MSKILLQRNVSISAHYNFAERIAETDARIRRAMDERELLIEHLLRKMQAQYPGGEKEEGSSVQLVQMCITLASAAKQLASVQDTSEWVARKRSLSRLLGVETVDSNVQSMPVINKYVFDSVDNVTKTFLDS